MNRPARTARVWAARALATATVALALALTACGTASSPTTTPPTPAPTSPTVEPTPEETEAPVEVAATEEATLAVGPVEVLEETLAGLPGVLAYEVDDRGPVQASVLVEDVRAEALAKALEAWVVAGEAIGDSEEWFLKVSNPAAGMEESGAFELHVNGTEIEIPPVEHLVAVAGVRSKSDTVFVSFRPDQAPQYTSTIFTDEEDWFPRFREALAAGGIAEGVVRESGGTVVVANSILNAPRVPWAMAGHLDDPAWEAVLDYLPVIDAEIDGLAGVRSVDGCYLALDPETEGPGVVCTYRTIDGPSAEIEAMQAELQALVEAAGGTFTQN